MVPLSHFLKFTVKEVGFLLSSYYVLGMLGCAAYKEANRTYRITEKGHLIQVTRIRVGFLVEMMPDPNLEGKLGIRQ